jgi:hypothetical protein
MLTHQRVLDTFGYDPKTGFLTWKISRAGRRPIIPGSRAGRVRWDGRYRVIGIDNKGHLEHRLIWFYVHGVWPKQLDHINRDGLDNRITNLRSVTSKQNQRNRRELQKNNTSGYRGVHRIRDKWKAVAFGQYVGFFETKEEAATAVKLARGRD